MPAGKYRHRVTIQDHTTARDDYGAEVPTWQTLTTVWAAIEPLTGRELLQAQQLTATVTHRITLRHLTGVTPEMRVLYGARVLEIEAVTDPMEHGKEVSLLAREVVT